MKKFGIALATIAAVVLLYKLIYPTDNYRYRMTVDVDVDGKVHSGSSVIEVSVHRQPALLPEMGPFTESVRGEAVLVELPDGRNIVALLASIETGQDMSYPGLAVLFAFNLIKRADIVRSPGVQGSRELPKDHLPTLATISDPASVASLQILQPVDLEKVLGPKVRLRGIRIEMTTDPVTHAEIEKRLPFIARLRDSQVEYPGPPRFYLQQAHFIRN
jgi:hypothetical protein